jgi:hypothetical protein
VTRRRSTLLIAVSAAAGVTLAAMAQPQPQPAVSTQGTWQPLSRAIEPLGPLTVSAIEIRWSICKGARVARVEADLASTVYAVEGQPGCVLDGQRITHLKLVPKPGGAAGRCGAELSLFSSEKAWRETQPDAWGLVERSPCP